MNWVSVIVNLIWAVIGGIIGMVVTAIVVAADWDEKPRRHRGYWTIDDEGKAHCPLCDSVFEFNGHEPTDYCPCCGAEMKGVRNSGNCDSRRAV